MVRTPGNTAQRPFSAHSGNLLPLHWCSQPGLWHLPWGHSQEMPPPWEKVCGQRDVPFASCCFPKGRGTDLLALTKWLFTVEQPGMHRAWSWQSGTWVQSLGNTTMGKSSEFSVARLISHARRRGQLSMFLFKSETALKVRSYEKKDVLHFLETGGIETTNQGTQRSTALVVCSVLRLPPLLPKFLPPAPILHPTVCYHFHLGSNWCWGWGVH